MADLFNTLAARILAVVVDARGADGSLGAEATARSIPAGRFRRTVGEVAFRQSRLDDPLRTKSYPIESFDRAVQLRWMADRDEPGPGNTQQAPEVCRATFALELGLLYKEEAARFAQLAGAETGAGDVAPLASRARGLNDQRRIKRALEFNDLVVGGIDPSIAGIVREGDATIEDLGGGRALAVARFALYYELSLSSNYDP